MGARRKMETFEGLMGIRGGELSMQRASCIETNREMGGWNKKFEVGETNSYSLPSIMSER